MKGISKKIRRIKQTDEVITKDLGIYSREITDFFAFITDDENGEGVLAQIDDAGRQILYILNNAELEHVPKFRNNAIELGKRANKTVKQVRFTRTTDVEMLNEEKCNNEQ